MTWDVVVVGAGPAGVAAALAARRARPDAHVLLLDAHGFPRDKVCGDGIAPHALDVLAGLGVDPSYLVAGTAPVTTLRLRSPGGAEAVRRMRRSAYVVPREVFDARLVDAAVAAGVVLRRQRVRSVREDVDGVLVDDVQARAVVGADGAESVVRRCVGAGPARAGTVAVAVAVRGYAPADHAGEQLLTMTKGNWPAYAWVFSIGDGRANVGYGELVTGSPPTRAHLEARLRELLPGARPVALRGHRLPLSPGRPDVAHGRVLLAGDAASLINPITGEGIYYAVLSGSLAGAAAVLARPDVAYRRALRAELSGHLRHTDVLARLCRATRVVDAGVRAARESPRTFDALVELGLGSGRLDARTAASVLRWFR
ncbi:MAG TPA: NAD(P)/FAD-dependent oxidoreductase [Jatrophihabitantaceae bacterium]